MLNFGVPIPPPPLRLVSSRMQWACLRLADRLLGSSPFLTYTEITPEAARHGRPVSRPAA